MMATTASAREAFLARAREYVSRDCEVYGLPSGGPFYEGLVNYLTDSSAHDFRLNDLAAVTKTPDMLCVPRRMLDVGCGPGTLVWKALALGHDAYGVDLNVEKIELARLRARADNEPARQDRVQVADAGQLPFSSESFDVVTSYHVLEHVADLPSVLYEAVRVTKRGGWLELRAPDYRMSYDTHYCMPWPRFMPPAQAEQWCAAMGRPTLGIGTFFYITAPQVCAILVALGCRIETLTYREHRDGRVFASDGATPADPVIVQAGFDVRALAAELQSLSPQGRLPAIYKTCLEFTIAAQRL